MLTDCQRTRGAVARHLGCDVPGWKSVKAVWLLAGSAGATAAVQRFFATFRSCPPVAFLYAQHFDPMRQEQLKSLTASNKKFHMELIEGRHYLAPGRVLIVPPRQRITFGEDGVVSASGSGWEGGHTPDIDDLQVLLAAARLPSRGVILFSGMGCDGAGSLDVLDASACRIWVQDPATAICRGIPAAALATGRVHRQGSPELLAQSLEQLYIQA